MMSETRPNHVSTPGRRWLRVVFSRRGLIIVAVLAATIALYLAAPGIVTTSDAEQTELGMTMDEVCQILGDTGAGFKTRFPDGRETWSYVLQGTAGSAWFTIGFSPDGRLEQRWL